jgi:surface carbohydrate biosynthesis protein
MVSTNIPLIIPVEDQRRELASKLLLACIAAKRGFPVLIGPNREIESRIASFPRGVFLAYRMKSGNAKLFRIIRKLGHEIVAWDEEALVHLPPEMYYSRRLSPEAVQMVSHLFAWGKDNVELWRQYSHLPSDIPIHITGNPRADLLRPELNLLYRKEADEILKRYGEFILINTNFNHVNAFYPFLNLFQSAKNPGEIPKIGRAAIGMTLEYAKGFQEHKKALFQAFQQLIPALDQEFPQFKIIVRPHPVEDQQIYQRIAAQCSRVHVTNEGNVVLWLQGAKALIHNGCTTGIEAYLLGVPAISYRSTVNDLYDKGFYRLPNCLSYQCFNFEELCKTLAKILAGKIGMPNTPETKQMIDDYLSAMDGPLSCERIVDVLEKIKKNNAEFSRLSVGQWLQGRFMAYRRRLRKQNKRTALRRHRYPDIAEEEIQKQILRYKQVLGISTDLKVKQVFNQVFRISP